MLSADTVAINRLDIRGDKAGGQRWAADVRASGWPLPLPGHLHQAWILVRQLEVAGRVAELRELAGRELHAQISAACDATSSGAERANAVWFASFPALIAFLLADIAMGRASKWYWQRWSYLLKYSRQEAIARLMFEQLAYLPAVIASLKALGRLRNVWSQLSAANAQVLVRELVRVHGLPAPAGWWPPASTLAASVMAAPLAVSTMKTAAHWKPLLEGLAPTDGRVLLACTLEGLTHTPIWLKLNPAKVLVGFLASLGEPGSPQPLHASAPTATPVVYDLKSSRLQPRITETPGPSPSAPAQALTLAAGVPELSKETTRQGEIPVASQDLQIDAGGRLSHEETSVSHSYCREKHHTPLRQEAANSQADDQETVESSIYGKAVPDTETSGFLTRAGGFFYLLNPIHRLISAEVLARQTQSSGWLWLWDLQELLARRYAHLEPLFDQPFKRFLVRQMNPYANEFELADLAEQLAQVGPGETATQLYNDLEKSCGNNEFWQELKVTSGFLDTPAQVVATASHLDIYLPLDRVRLDLRLQAWDTNPGWLPWLGRVVSFHYVESQALGDTSS